jgi:hypothetical protein
LNFIFGIVCLFVCVCAFSLRRESPDMILGDKPLIFEVVLSHPRPILEASGIQFPNIDMVMSDEERRSSVASMTDGGGRPPEDL